MAAKRGSGTLGRVVETAAVFSAQVGLWRSELVVSQGLLEHLNAEHLEAVLAHESGHAHYRDTFWFFWLGGLRRLTGWLPQSETLWQELLLLREVRADEWAARRVDSLVLAESLMSVITAPLLSTEAICASFSCAAPRSRLAQRVDAFADGIARFGPHASLVFGSTVECDRAIPIALNHYPVPSLVSQAESKERGILNIG